MRQPHTAQASMEHMVIPPKALNKASVLKQTPPHEEKLRMLLEELPRYILTPQTRTPSWKVFLKRLGVGVIGFSPLCFFLPIGLFLMDTLRQPASSVALLGLLALIMAIGGMLQAQKLEQAFKISDTSKLVVQFRKQVILKLIHMSEDDVIKGRLAELFSVVADDNIDKRFWETLASISESVPCSKDNEHEALIASLQQHYRNQLVSERVQS